MFQWLPQHYYPIHFNQDELAWCDRIIDLFLQERIDKLTYLDWIEKHRDAVTRTMVEVFEKTH